MFSPESSKSLGDSSEVYGGSPFKKSPSLRERSNSSRLSGALTEIISPLSPARETSISAISANLMEEEFKKPFAMTKSTPRSLISSLTFGIETATPKRLIKSLTAAEATPLSSEKVPKTPQVKSEESDASFSPASARSAQAEHEPEIGSFIQSQREESRVFETIQKFGEDISSLEQEWARLAEEAKKINDKISPNIPSEQYENVLKLLEDQEDTLENLNKALQQADKNMDSLNRDIVQLQGEVEKFKRSLDEDGIYRSKTTVIYFVLVFFTVFILGVSIMSFLWIFLYIWTEGHPPSFFNITQHILYLLGIENSQTAPSFALTFLG